MFKEFDEHCEKQVQTCLNDMHLHGKAPDTRAIRDVLTRMQTAVSATVVDPNQAEHRAALKRVYDAVGVLSEMLNGR